MSAINFYRSVVSACEHFGTTGTFHFVHCSVMSAKNLYRSVMSAEEIYRSVVSAYESIKTTAVSRYFHVWVEPFPSTIFYYISIYRNLFELTLCELIIIRYIPIPQ